MALFNKYRINFILDLFFFFGKLHYFCILFQQNISQFFMSNTIYSFYIYEERRAKFKLLMQWAFLRLFYNHEKRFHFWNFEIRTHFGASILRLKFKFVGCMVSIIFKKPNHVFRTDLSNVLFIIFSRDFIFVWYLYLYLKCIFLYNINNLT